MVHLLLILPAPISFFVANWMTEKAALTAIEPAEDCHALMVPHDSYYSEPQVAEDNGSFIPSRETPVMSWNDERFREISSDSHHPLILCRRNYCAG
jgi:hypothetical protein